MSTTERFFSDEDLAGMVADLKEWPNISCGNEEQELGVSPFVSFYFLYDTRRHVETSLLMVDIHEEFERLTGKSYLIGTHPDSERPHPYGSKRLPDLREFARKVKSGQTFMFNFTDEKNHRSSPTTAGYFWKVKDYMNDREISSNKTYSGIQFFYRWSWWRENRDAWRRFVLQTIEKLNAEQVYSGFAMADPLEFGTRAEVTVWERALAPHFYGLDIDYQFSARGELTSGIRPPTWGFLLSDVWREKLNLGRDDLKDALHHPHIHIHDLASGLWIELGEEPSLYPVEEGVPELPVMLNKILKPIRHDHMGLLGFGQWDGDPNERFTNADSLRWMRRFDKNSDWPRAEVRNTQPPSPFDLSEPTVGELRAKAGDPCPQEGKWESLDIPSYTRRYEKGEMVADLGSSYGLTVWRYLGD